MARARTHDGRQPPLQAPQTSHYSRDTRMWPSLLGLLCPGQRRPPWHCQPHVAEQEPVTQDRSRVGRARPGLVCLCKSTVTVWASAERGIPLSGSAHSLSTWTHGNRLSLNSEPCASQLAAHTNSVCLLDHILTFQNLVLSGNPGN